MNPPEIFWRSANSIIANTMPKCNSLLKILKVLLNACFAMCGTFVVAPPGEITGNLYRA